MWYLISHDLSVYIMIYIGVLFSNKGEWIYIVCGKMDGTGDDQVKQGKPNSERQILHVFSPMQNLDLKNMLWL
jgi:hypothetical protein